MPGADIVTLCVDFYKDGEIAEARAVLNSCVSDQAKRIPKRQGPDRSKKILDVIVKFLANPQLSLPVFYAVDLSRFLPVDAH